MSKRKDGTYTPTTRKHVSLPGDLRNRFRTACEERKVPMGPLLDTIINDALDKQSIAPRTVGNDEQRQ